jgi:CheY-like chemotaxis protein
VLGGVLATVNRLAEVRGLALRTALQPGLPAVTANRLALRHILLNVLGYLLDLAESGCIYIGTSAGESAVEVRFSVQGGGSAPSLDEAKAGNAALAAAMKLANMQGLQLDFEEPGDGSTALLLSLPASRARTLLLVEDNPDVGRLFRHYLVGTDWCLVHARSAEKGIQLAQANRPDMIVLDILLPGNDGWQFLESLRSDGDLADVPVIASSVVPEQSLALSLGVVEFLPKPVKQASLLAALARWSPLQGSGARPGSSEYSAPARQRSVPRPG